MRGGLGGRQRALPERVEHMADEGGCVTKDELLMLFKDVQDTRRPCPPPSWRRATQMQLGMMGLFIIHPKNPASPPATAIMR